MHFMWREFKFVQMKDDKREVIIIFISYNHYKDDS